jgi:hypothetical protein
MSHSKRSKAFIKLELSTCVEDYYKLSATEIMAGEGDYLRGRIHSYENMLGMKKGESILKRWEETH